MEAAIDRVMLAYGLMVNLTSAEEPSVREQVSQFLADKTGDEHQLAVEGLRYLRAQQQV